MHFPHKLLPLHNRKMNISTHFGGHALERQSAGCTSRTAADDHHVPLLQGTKRAAQSSLPFGGCSCGIPGARVRVD